MSKVWVMSSIIIISGVFLYSMVLISDANKCSWVRTFECQKQENLKKQKLEEKMLDVKSEKYIQLNDVSRIFLNQCKPDVIENKDDYTVDYSNCVLKVWVFKDKDWIKSVNLNWKDFTRSEIDNSFKK